MSLMDVGVLGGTFDPVHVGHMAIAEAAMGSLGLYRVIFVPVGQPWLKPEREITLGEHRVAMIRLAAAPNPSFVVSAVDMERRGPSYTVDTLADVKRELDTEANLYFILGMDALAELPSWREPQRIVEMCNLVAARRPGCDDSVVAGLEKSLPGVSGRVTVLDNPLIDISSSEIRKRVAAGLSIDGMVSEKVARYIAEKGLYRKEA